jgi:preprotein translocase subunit SecB
MKPSPLQLNHTAMGEIRLVPKEAEEFASSVNVTTTPSFGRNDNDPNQWQIKMRILFKGANDKPAPYEGHIEVMGVFTVLATEVPEEQKLRLVAITCPSILYATAREVIASLTARSVNGLFLLPSVSFADQTLEPQDTPAAVTDPKG